MMVFKSLVKENKFNVLSIVSLLARIARKPVRDFFIYAGGDAIANGLNIILLPVYTRVLNPSAYGVLELVIVSTTILSIVLSFGLHQLVGVYYFRYEEEHRKQVVVNISSIYLLIATPLFFLCLPFSGTINNYLYSGEATMLIVILVLLTGYLRFFDTFLFSLLQMERKVVAYTELRVLIVLIVLSLNILLVVYLRLDVLGVVIAALVGKAASTCFAIYLWNMHYRSTKPSLRWSLIYEFLTTALPLMTTSLLAWALVAADRFLLGYFLGSDAVGIYSVAYKFPVAFELLFVSAVAKVYSPRILNMYRVKGYADTERLNNRYLVIYILVTGIASVGLLGFLYLFYPLLVGEEFQSSFKYIPWLLAGTVFIGARYFANYLLLYEGRTKAIMLMHLLAVISAILMNLVLIPQFGITSAAFATTFSYVILFLLTNFYKQRVFRGILQQEK